MGAGNGTLMLNILDYIRAADADVYARTQFRVIEVSSALATLQANQLTSNASSRGHADKVKIVNKSIFDWDIYQPSPCFFLAMEVFDNFAHDLIRYDQQTDTPHQASVLIDAEGDFYEFNSASLDPLAERFVDVRNAACAASSSSSASYRHPRRSNRLSAKLRAKLPLQYNLTEPEYIPTRLMQFFEVLARYFPEHRLVASDFHALPDAIEGWCAPVVQTRYKRKMVPVTTPLVSFSSADVCKTC